MNHTFPITNLSWAMDGELCPSDANRVESHLKACWACRSRKTDLKEAISDFVHFHRSRPELLCNYDRENCLINLGTERSWARDPIVLAETKGTPEVHEKKEAVN